MNIEKQFLKEMSMKMGKVYTAKDNPPFKVQENSIDNLLGLDKSNKINLPPNTDITDIVKQIDKENDGNDYSGGTQDYSGGTQDYSGGEQDYSGNKIEQDKIDATGDNEDETTNDNKDKKGGIFSKIDLKNPSHLVGLGVGGLATAAVLKKMKKQKEKKQNESVQLNEGPSYEYRKYTTKIAKSMKQHQAAVLDFYELLRKKGLDKEAAMLLNAYKKNLVTFKKSFDVLMRKLV